MDTPSFRLAASGPLKPHGQSRKLAVPVHRATKAGFRLRLEAEEFGGIDLGHAIDFRDGEAVAVQVLIELEQAIGM